MDPRLPKFLKLKDEEEIVREFWKTLLPTNKDFGFLVDWKKVSKQLSEYKFEIPLFNVLIKDKTFDKDLKELLTKYPKSAKVIPLLLAISEKDGKNLVLTEDFLNWNFNISEINFAKFSPDNKDELDKIVEFVDKAGLKKFFLNLAARSIEDYFTGVKVGMDTNARKNRSGKRMEKLLQPKIENYAKKYGFQCFSQKTFGKLSDKINVPPSLSSRKADFILTRKDKWINIEVDFFNTSGSKPEEIVNSYADRQNEIKEHNGDFIFVTDGAGWRKENKDQQNQVRVAFEKIDFVLNLEFVRRGILEEIIKSI